MRWRLIYSSCAVLFAVMFAGCATSRIAGPSLPAPPSEKQRAAWHVVAVTGGQGTPQVTQLNTKGKGAGATAAALNSAAGTTAVLGGIGGGYGAAAGIFISPAMALIGATVGLFKAESASQVKEHHAVLQNAYASIDWQTTLRDPVIAATRQHTRLEVIPFIPGEATARAQVVLEVQITDLGLIADIAANPDLQFIMAEHTRVVCPDTNEVIYEHRLLYQGTTHRFAEWAANDAQLWREQVEIARQRLAERIVYEVFLLYRMEDSIR